MPMNIHAYEDKYTTKRMLIAAKFSGLDVKLLNTQACTGTSARIPILETDKGCIFTSGAITRYLSGIRRDLALLGNNLLEAGLVDSWVEYSAQELEVPLRSWINQAKGTATMPAQALEMAKADAKKALEMLNNHLLANTYMVGHVVTLADISIFCTVADGFGGVFDAAFLKPLGNFVRWFELLSMQPEFAAAVGAEKNAAGAASKAEKKEGGGAPKAEKNAAGAASKAEKKEGGGAKQEPAKHAGEELRASKVVRFDDPKEKAEKLPAAAAAPAATGGASKAELEAQVTAVGDQLRKVKEGLKKEGLAGKKLNSHEEVLKLIAQLTDLKAKVAAAPEGPAKPAEDQAAAARKAQLKKVVKEGGKRGVEIEGAADMGGLGYFCTSVDEPAGDLEMMDACMEAMNAEVVPGEEERKGGSGKIGKMIFSAGTDQLAIVAYVPVDKKAEVDATEWMRKVVALHGGELASGCSDVYARGFVKADGNKGKFPLKMKEPSITEAIGFLKAKGVFPDNDSDDDEMVFGDDDFPS
eukprot:NODE_5253_length_1792_cov_3.533934.p1 GENE.NODE_5253_length_1792_cov_3.533934~~NODE_5253_length_1792_cov_3.533934.p1  ORF type:complete len:526 (-),score=177.18 NODE_5253_length_1792_cov_3.533934:125-1702(-)